MSRLVTMNGRTQQLVAAIAFALVQSQDPLYTANQNTKYLHGAATAGYGMLQGDWTANTTDPLPVFSALVRLMFAVGLPQLSYIIFALLMAAYAWTLTSVVRAAGLLDHGRRQLAVFLAGLIVTQGVFSQWPDGLADQYLSDHYLQPCVFGVLLIAGIAQYLQGRTATAIVLVATASFVHPDYLPTTFACALTFVALPRDARPPEVKYVLRHALLTTVLLAPLAFYLRRVFAPTTPELWQKSLEVLVTVRIPHHTEVAHWLDAGAVLRLIVMAVGAALARDWALRAVMWVLFALIAGSMALTAAFGLEALEAVTPWRASVLLMPVALAVILARLSERMVARAARREHRVMTACAYVIASAVVYGVWDQAQRWHKYHAAASMPPIVWVREHSERPEVYLVPARDGRFDRFRLETGQPQLVSWKTHPYKDVELLEWQRRLQGADGFYDARSAEAACIQLRTLAREYSVSAVIYAGSHPVASRRCDGLTELARAGDFVVARVAAGAP